MGRVDILVSLFFSFPLPAPVRLFFPPSDRLFPFLDFDQFSFYFSVVLREKHFVPLGSRWAEGGWGSQWVENRRDRKEDGTHPFQSTISNPIGFPTRARDPRPINLFGQESGRPKSG